MNSNKLSQAIELLLIYKKFTNPKDEQRLPYLLPFSIKYENTISNSIFENKVSRENYKQIGKVKNEIKTILDNLKDLSIEEDKIDPSSEEDKIDPSSEEDKIMTLSNIFQHLLEELKTLFFDVKTSNFIKNLNFTKFQILSISIFSILIFIIPSQISNYVEVDNDSIVTLTPTETQQDTVIIVNRRPGIYTTIDVEALDTINDDNVEVVKFDPNKHTVEDGVYYDKDEICGCCFLKKLPRNTRIMNINIRYCK